MVLTDNGILHTEYYQIGKGNLISYKGFDFTPSVTKVTEWISSLRQNTNIAQRQTRQMFSCSECDATFKSNKELLQHNKLGIHRLLKQTKSDQIRDLFIEQKYLYNEETAITIANFNDRLLTEEEMDEFNNFYSTGWARPFVKQTKFSDKQKQFVKDCFMRGERNKADKLKPEEIHKRMQEEFGNLRECLTVPQIGRLITKYCTQVKNNSFFENDNEEVMFYLLMLVL